MPKLKKSQKVRVTPGVEEALGPEIPSVIPLILEERERLRQMLADPVLVKAWKNAEMSRPSLWGNYSGDHGGGAPAANNRLHQLQGWELHKIALIRQALDPKLSSPKPQDTYPVEGTLEHEMKQRLLTRTKNE